MFKRLTAILITLAMLFGMCAVVTADTTDPYEYLPRNITVACYDGDNSVSVAWINPTKQLTKVTVYDSNNRTGTDADAEIGTVNNPKAGEISRVTNTECRITNACFRAKLVFEFTDGQKRIVYHTQDIFNLNGGSSNNRYTPNTVEIGRNGDYNVYTTNEENCTVAAGTKTADKSLKIVSNIDSNMVTGAPQIYFNFKANGTINTAGSLKTNTDYKFEYKVKTKEKIKFTNFINCSNGTVTDTKNETDAKSASEWQTISGTFKTKESFVDGENDQKPYTYFAISFKQATAEPFYIDDVKITELDSNGIEVADNVEGSTTHTYDFEDLASTQVARKLASVTASSADGGAEISWTPYTDTNGYLSGKERYVNVYKMVDSKRVLRARMSHMRDGSSDLNFIVDKSVYIDGLTNGKEYKFAVTTMTMDGIESEATEVTVTPEKQVISKYEYEPANVMITGWRGGWDAGKGYAVSWINPTSDKLSSVKLYEINSDGTETAKTPNRIFYRKIYGDINTLNANTITDVTTPGAVVRFENQPLETESGTATYRIVFEFSDGQKRDIVYTGDWNSGSYYQIIQPTDNITNKNLISVNAGWGYSYIADKGSNDTLLAMADVKISQKEVKGDSQVSLELLSNQTTDGRGKHAEINLSKALTSGSTYNFSMDVNTVETGGITLGSTYAGDSDGNKLPNTNGKWQTVTGQFKANGKTLNVRTGTAMRETYIDNIKVWGNDINESEPATYSFSEVTISAPEDVSGVSATQGEKTSTTISWDATSGGGQYVNVYEDIDKNTTDDVHTWMFRARAPKAQASVKLNNLETDSTHNFMVVTEKSGAQYNGLESAGVTCSATLVMPDYEINDVKLLANDEEVENFIPGGTYTAQANVTNAKIDDGLKTQVIVAVYANGVLENCVVSDAKTVTKGASETITVPSFTIGNKDKTYTAKIMVWKGLESVTPLLKNSVTYTTAE